MGISINCSMKQINIMEVTRDQPYQSMERIVLFKLFLLRLKKI
jgi:hypothetical protein